MNNWWLAAALTTLATVKLASPAADTEVIVADEIESREDMEDEDFRKDFLYPNRPVVIRGAMRNWGAMARWTPEFFREKYGHRRFSIEDDLSAKALLEKRNGPGEYTMAEFIDRVLNSTPENPAPYFRNKVIDEMFPELRGDIQPLPSYIFPNWLNDRFLLAEVGKKLNRGAAIELYIGGEGGSFPVLHYDGVASHAFLMQIYGKKRFVLYPPQQERFLYPSPEKPNLSMINSVETPDLERFPLFAKAKASTLVLKPGEILFIPSKWWHTTRMLTPCISVSANVVNDSNWDALIDYVTERQEGALKAAVCRTYLTAGGMLRRLRQGTKGIPS